MSGQRFIIRPDDRDDGWRVANNCKAHIREQLEGLTDESPGIEVFVRPHKRDRSLAQNRCLHAWCKAIADFHEQHWGDRIMPEAWKEWFKAQVFGQIASVMPDGRVQAITQPSSQVSVERFVELLDYIDRWAAETLQLDLPRGVDYREAMKTDDQATSTEGAA